MNPSQRAKDGWVILVKGCQLHGIARRNGKSALLLCLLAFICTIFFQSWAPIDVPLGLIFAAGLSAMFAFVCMDEASRCYERSSMNWVEMQKALTTQDSLMIRTPSEQWAFKILNETPTISSEQATRLMWPWENPFS